MAVQCPACSHIHFETNDRPRPTHCERCEQDLTEQPVPRTDAHDSRSEPTATSKPMLFTGLVLLSFAGWFLLQGEAERSEYRTATATVTSWSTKKEVERQPQSSGDSIRYQEVWTVRASYSLEGKTYPVDSGKRWKNGDTFAVWYHPDSPADASQNRPFWKLFFGVTGLVVGLYFCGLAFGVFDGAAETFRDRAKTTDSSQNSMGLKHRPTTAPAPVSTPPPTAMPRWFAEDNRRQEYIRRLRG